MIDIYGHSFEHLPTKCPVCGYATRFKQFPIRCACNRSCSKEELPEVAKICAPGTSLILRGKNESVRPSRGSPSTSGCWGETEEMMSAERGWIGDPQPPKEWHDSHYSRQADRLRRIAERNWRRIEESIRRDEQELAEGDGAPWITGSND